MMSNPQGFRAYIPFQANQRKRDLGLLGRGDKLWESNQEKYGKQGSYSKVCYEDLSQYLLY